MISIKEALVGAVLVTALGMAGMTVLARVSLDIINEVHDKLDATRVAHDETRVLLIECRRKVHKLTNEVQNVQR